MDYKYFVYAMENISKWAFLETAIVFLYTRTQSES